MSLPWGACQLQESPAPSRACDADTGRSSPAHRLLHRGRPVGGRIPQSLAHLQGAPHLRVEAGALQGRLPLLVLQSDVRVPGQEEAAQRARHRTLSPSVQDSTTRCTQCKRDPPPAPRRHSPRPGAASHHADTASSPQALSFVGRAQKLGMASDFSQLFH